MLEAHAGLTGHLPDSLAQGPELHVDILVQIYRHLPRGKKETGAAEHKLGCECGILELDAPAPDDPLPHFPGLSSTSV